MFVTVERNSWKKDKAYWAKSTIPNVFQLSFFDFLKIFQKSDTQNWKEQSNTK